MRGTFVFLSLMLLSLTACVKSSSFDEQVLSAKLSPQLSVLRASNEEEFSVAQKKFTQSQLEKALRVAANTLINRDPTPTEITALSAGGLTAYETTIKSYLEDPLFATTQLAYYRSLFEMGGTTGGVNFDEPSNLAVYLIKNDISFQEVLTADYCVANNLSKTTCAAFNNDATLAAAQGAGAITTRAFLSKWAASFNFRRVMKTFKVFACREYPDASDIGLTAAEIADTASGSPKDFTCTTCTPACFSCHKVMNPRASLFYNFDRTGVYTTNTNTSTVTDTGVNSKLTDLLKGDGKAVYHSREVKKVREYAILLSQNKTFRDCLAQRLTNYMMGRTTYSELLPDFQNVRDNVEFNDFKVKSILLEIAMHPAFVVR